MVFDNPHLTGQYIPLYTLNIQGHLFHCSIVDLGRSFFKTFAPIRCAWEIFVWKSSKICFPQNHAIGSGKWDPPKRGSFLCKNSRFFQFEYGKKNTITKIVSKKSDFGNPNKNGGFNPQPCVSARRSNQKKHTKISTHVFFSSFSDLKKYPRFSKPGDSV